MLAGRAREGPLVLQKSLYPEGPEVCHGIVLHPPGGMVGGDVLTLSAQLGVESRVLLTTPGAGRWYRSNALPAAQETAFRLADGALLEWLPQETIFFDGARAALGLAVEISGSAVFCGWEILCLGRQAAGEGFNSGIIRLSSEIRLDGRRLWMERAQLDGADPLLHSPVGLAGRPVAATLVLAGWEAPPEALAACRGIGVREEAGELCGVTRLPRLLIARYLGASAEAAKTYFIALWQRLRPCYAGREAVLPRIWAT